MFDTDCAAVVTGLAIVATVQTVEVVAVNMGRAIYVVFAASSAAIKRDTVVRHVVGFQVVVTHCDPRISTQTKSERRRHAPTAYIHIVTTGDIGLVLHKVQAKGRGVGQLFVQIQGGAFGLV
ncbi:hypothetical protein D3C79_957600 [compost metagenome]